MADQLFDALGNLIKSGDYLAYPGIQGSRSWMNLGRVVSFESDPRRSPGVYMVKVELGGKFPASKSFTSNLHRSVVVSADQVPLAVQELVA